MFTKFIKIKKIYELQAIYIMLAFLYKNLHFQILNVNSKMIRLKYKIKRYTKVFIILHPHLNDMELSINYLFVN